MGDDARHQFGATFEDAAAQEECLWIEDSDGIGDEHTDDEGGIVPEFDGVGETETAIFFDIFSGRMFAVGEAEVGGCDESGLDIVQDAVFDGFTAGVPFDASELTAAAGDIGEGREFTMSDFAADVIGAEEQFSFMDEAGADACADVDGEESGEVMSGAEVIFAPGDGVEVVGDTDTDIGDEVVELLAQDGVEVDIVPIEVGGVQDGMFVDGDLSGDSDADARELSGFELVFCGDIFDDAPDDEGDVFGRMGAADGCFLSGENFKLTLIGGDEGAAGVCSADIEPEKILSHGISLLYIMIVFCKDSVA